MYCVSKLRRDVRRAWLLSLFPLAGFAGDALDEVVVSATRLRDQAQIDVPASVSVLSSQTLNDSANQHFEEVLTQIPNLNWAAGSSRPRYFQIRGIGEREQYEGAPNSSVGFLIDDIDFSGIGMAATLFDVDRIEVLRGPQGARLGANALAGIIAVQTADPESEYNARVVAEVGDYDTHSLGLSATGPIESLDSSWRVALQKYKSDGFRTNSFLHRDDTNGRDELTARGKWRWSGDHGQLDLTLMHANLDNGYDAFSIDNSRVTLSDQPGQDTQRVNAGALKWSSTFTNNSALTLIATASDSNSIYSFDADWGNPASWAPYDYSYYYESARRQVTQTVEARLASPSAKRTGEIAWLVGAYGKRLREQLDEASNYDDPLHSDFDADTTAAFAQIDGRFAARWLWTASARMERRDATYSDSRPTSRDRHDSLLGGNLALTYQVNDYTRTYASVARGYKAGGFNLGTSSALRPTFGPEYLWNYELGWKTELNKRFRVDGVLFSMQRKDMQIRSGEQADPSNPGTYIFVTTNVARGENYGAELSGQWLPLDILEVGGSVGLLETSMTGAVDSKGNLVPSRSQPHAPNYQLQFNLTYRGQTGLMARVDYAAVDAFYFDVATDHNQRSSPYELVNFKMGYEAQHWSVHGWVRNLFDEQYATRGFYFVNDPVSTTPKLYIQNGDPRTFGISVEWTSR